MIDQCSFLCALYYTYTLDWMAYSGFQCYNRRLQGAGSGSPRRQDEGEAEYLLF